MEVMLVFVFCAIFIGAQADNTIRVNAMGRVADLGDFYDFRSEQFLSISAYKDDLPDSAYKVTQDIQVRVDAKIVHKYSERNRLSGMSAHFQVAAYAGIIEPSGSTEVMTRFQLSSNVFNGILVYREKRGLERIKIRKPVVRKLFSPEIAPIIGATHVVYGIKWGANVVAAFQFAKSETINELTYETELDASLHNMALSLKAQNSFQAFSKALFSKTSFAASFFGDVQLKRPFTSNFTEVLEILEEIPKTLNNTNGGKGRPLEYILLPIQTLAKISDHKPKGDYLNITQTGHTYSSEILDLEHTLLSIFYSHETNLQLHSSMQSSLGNNIQHIPENLSSTVDSFHQKYTRNFNLFKASLPQLLKAAKSDLTDAVKEKLNATISTFQNGAFGLNDYRKQQRYSLSVISKKLADIRHLRAYKINFTLKGDTIYKALSTSLAGSIFFFYVKEEWRSTHVKLWNDLFLLFVEIDSKRFFVDCDIEDLQMECDRMRSPTIVEYQHGILIQEINSTSRTDFYKRQHASDVLDFFAG